MSVLLRKWCHSNKRFSSWWGNSWLMVYMQWRNYVSVTLCIR